MGWLALGGAYWNDDGYVRHIGTTGQSGRSFFRPKTIWFSFLTKPGATKLALEVPLLCRSKILIADRGCARALDADKPLAGFGVAAVATICKLVEGGGELGTALCFDRFLQLLQSRIDEGLDQLGDRNSVIACVIFCRILQAFLDLVDLIGREVPVVALAGTP